ncbi:MAG: hypothetical protein AB1646_26255 [Thermodesulfobacteriota bacterium]
MMQKTQINLLVAMACVIGRSNDRTHDREHEGNQHLLTPVEGTNLKLEGFMGDLMSVIIGGVIGIAGGLVKDYCSRKWDKERWLLDHEARECADCIDLLWASLPPESQ